MSNGEQDRKIEAYINRCTNSKLPVDATQSTWAKFHSHWQHVETTARGLAVNIWKGFSFAPVFDGRKTKENFLYAWHIALDFDTEDERSSLAYLASRDYIDWFASFAYTTPSHSDEKPKARVVWVFEEPIRSREEYETLYQALLFKFPWADQSAKDAARFFYGSDGADVWDNWSIFPEPARDVLVSEYRETLTRKKERRQRVIRMKPSGDYANYVKAAIENECDSVMTAPDGERHEARFKAAISLGTLVGAPWANLDETTALNRLTNAAMKNTDTPQQAIERVIRDGLERGRVEPRPEPQKTYAVASAGEIL